MTLIFNILVLSSARAESVKERLKRARDMEKVTLPADSKTEDEKKAKKWDQGYEKLENCRKETDLHANEIKTVEQKKYELHEQKRNDLTNLGYKRSNLNIKIKQVNDLTADFIASNADAIRKKEVLEDTQKEIVQLEKQRTEVEAQLITTEKEYEDKLLTAQKEYDEFMKKLCP